MVRGNVTVLMLGEEETPMPELSYSDGPDTGSSDGKFLGEEEDEEDVKQSISSKIIVPITVGIDGQLDFLIERVEDLTLTAKNGFDRDYEDDDDDAATVEPVEDLVLNVGYEDDSDSEDDSEDELVPRAPPKRPQHAMPMQRRQPTQDTVQPAAKSPKPVEQTVKATPPSAPTPHKTSPLNRPVATVSNIIRTASASLKAGPPQSTAQPSKGKKA